MVRPRFFPGGNIGDLAVNGTVNDVAITGAQPLALSVGVVLEEGLALEGLGRDRRHDGRRGTASRRVDRHR